MNVISRFFAFALALTLTAGAYAAMDANNFVEEASAKGIAEVEAGKLAQEKGVGEDVKAFADMMVKDHSAANEKLKTLAASKKISVSPDADLIDKAKAMILELRGAKSFDQAYANNQVKAHEAAIELFQDYSNSGEDAELKSFASATLPTLQAHLEKAKALAAAHNGDEATP